MLDVFEDYDGMLALRPLKYFFKILAASRQHKLVQEKESPIAGYCYIAVRFLKSEKEEQLKEISERNSHMPIIIVGE